MIKGIINGIVKARDMLLVHLLGHLAVAVVHTGNHNADAWLGRGAVLSLQVVILSIGGLGLDRQVVDRRLSNIVELEPIESTSVVTGVQHLERVSAGIEGGMYGAGLPPTLHGRDRLLGHQLLITHYAQSCLLA